MWKQRVTKYSLAVAMMLGAFVTCGGNASAAVDTCFWTGATNANWSTGSNWSCTTDGATAPGNGDTVTLPAGASNTAMNNDIAGLSLAAVSVNGTGYSLSGNSLSLSSSNPLTSNSDVTFSNNIAFTTTSNVFIRPATGTTITFNGTTSFATTGAFEVNVGLSGEAGTADFVGNVSGTAGSQFIASEGATITTRGTNTVTATQVGVELGGKFTCLSATCFGNAANTILIADGVVRAMSTGTYSNPIITGTASASAHAYLSGYETATFTGNITVNDDLSIQQISDNKTLTINGNIALTGDRIILNATGVNAKTVINGDISGDFDVYVTQGKSVLGGNNTYTGVTQVYGSNPGYLIVTSATGLGASTATAYTNIASGSTVDFEFSANGTVAERFNVWGDGAGGNGAIVASDGGGTPTLTGNIVLQSDATIGSYATAFNSFNVNSVIRVTTISRSKAALPTEVLSTLAEQPATPTSAPRRLMAQV